MYNSIYISFVVYHHINTQISECRVLVFYCELVTIVQSYSVNTTKYKILYWEREANYQDIYAYIHRHYI